MNARPLGDDIWDDRRRMVDDLLRELRGRSKQEGGGDVRLVETQLSWILLGREVFKIKKPVTLPFLDFGSFEAREQACRNEVRINRRLAPRVYLGVVPIRRGRDGRFTFRANGAIADWAVHMARLDDARRADQLLARTGLGRQRIDRLAAEIAQFHADSPSVPRIARCGSPDALERNVIQSFVALRDTAADLVSDEVLAEIERSQLAFARGHKALFEERVRGGSIRDGHGDLRLEHVFFEDDDQFEVIDGIEFDDRRRYADVCADVAAFAMDLARVGRADLAERFIAVYAREANDFDLYRLIDFYETYCACARARISAGAATTPCAAGLVRERTRAEARRYLLLAQSARRRSLIEPVLVAVGGGIAAGKTSLAERLAEEMSAPIVDADHVWKHMLGAAPTTQAWEYDPAFSERVDAEVLRRAEVVLASGRPVIIDASFRTPVGRSRTRELARRHRVPFRLLECVAPAWTCRERLEKRDPHTSASGAAPNVVAAFATSYEPILELCPTEHARIDTSGSLESAVEQAKRELVTWPSGLVG